MLTIQKLLRLFNSEKREFTQDALVKSKISWQTINGIKNNQLNKTLRTERCFISILLSASINLSSSGEKAICKCSPEITNQYKYIKQSIMLNWQNYTV